MKKKCWRCCSRFSNRAERKHRRAASDRSPPKLSAISYQQSAISYQQSARKTPLLIRLLHPEGIAPSLPRVAPQGSLLVSRPREETNPDGVPYSSRGCTTPSGLDCLRVTFPQVRSCVATLGDGGQPLRGQRISDHRELTRPERTLSRYADGDGWQCRGAQIQRRQLARCLAAV